MSRRAPMMILMLLGAAGAVMVLRGGNRNEAPPYELLAPELPSIPDSLTIRNDSLDFKVVPKDRMFWQERPTADWADLDRVSELLYFIRRAVIARVVEENAVDLSPYGLDKPSATIGVDTLSIRLGRENVVGDGRYALLNQSRDVLLVGKGFGRFSSIGPGELRDRIPIRFPIRSLRQLVISTHERTCTLSRRPGDDWYVEEFSVRASPIAVWRIARAIADARINSFEKGADQLTEPSGIRAGLSWPGGNADLELGGIVPGTALRRARSDNRDFTFRIPARIADSIRCHAESIVDMRLFSVEPAEAEIISVASPEGTFVIERRREGRWMITRGEKGTAREGRGPLVRAFLHNLVGAEAVDVVAPNVRAGIFQTVWTIDVDGESVEIDDRVEAAALARRNGEEGILVLGAGFWHALRTGADDLAPSSQIPPAGR